MNIFMQKGFIRKLIISIVCVILLNFCFAPNVQAKYGGEMTVLMREFATAIGDVAASVVQLGVTGKFISAVDRKGTGSPDGSDYWIKESKFQYPILQVSPELIFAGEIELLDVNFITPVNSRSYELELKNDSGLVKLRSIVASWYVTLRTIAIVGLLSVLIYIGIRIIISSTSGEKAKYKQRLLDWIIAFCLLFFMHYIMAATITVVEKVNDMLGDSTGIFDGINIPSEYGKVKFTETTIKTTDKNLLPNDVINTLPTIGDVTSDSILGTKVKVYHMGQWQELAKGINLGWVNVTDNINGDIYTKEFEIIENGSMGIVDRKVLKITFDTVQGHVTNGIITGDTNVFDCTEMQSYITDMKQSTGSVNGVFEVESSKTTTNGLRIEDGGDGSKILYFINYARLFLNVKDDDQYIPMSIAYLIIYIALVTFTAVFAIRYIKRVIYIAFLTMIAPLVALTYPLDKLKDRKSTGLGYVV